jgi:hypothetical protein
MEKMLLAMRLHSKAKGQVGRKKKKRSNKKLENERTEKKKGKKKRLNK